LFQQLAKHQITDQDVVLDGGDSLRIRTSVQKASNFFETQFYVFEHQKTGLKAIRQWNEFSIPSEIEHCVSLVLDVHTFPTIEQRLKMREALKLRRDLAQVQQTMEKLNSDTTPIYVPQSIAVIYGTPMPSSLIPGSNASVTVGVVEFVKETFSQKDLEIFSNKTFIPLIPPAASNIFGNNSEAPEAGLESTLDIQWIEGVNPAMTPWFWLESDPSNWMYSFTVDFLTATNYPTILSVSYGLPEIMQCEYFNPSDCYGLDYASYVREVDKQFRKIGLIGVSTIVCSQDRGVEATRNLGMSPFEPEYPATSPYATTVGATELRSPQYSLPHPPPACQSGSNWACVSGGQHAAVSYDVAGYLSGGGFSNVSSRAPYQADAVQAYLNSGVKLPPSSVYNKNGRGYPDVSAFGTNGYIYYNGPSFVGGTSMSTPIVAAIFGLLQAEYSSLTKGKQLGFLNYLLYQAATEAPQVYNDITVGDNCATAKCGGQELDGFLTNKGWDPVTGLGELNYPAWVDYIRKVAVQQNNKQGSAPSLRSDPMTAALEPVVKNTVIATKTIGTSRLHRHQRK